MSLADFRHRASLRPDADQQALQPQGAAARRTLAAAFRSRLAEVDLGPTTRTRRAVADEDLAAEIAERRIELRQHPCHSCPDRETHARWAEQALRLERENARLEERVSTRTNTIANHFDKICAVLESLGYLTGPEGGRVSEPGRMLARIYAELDLVAAECIRAGVFAGLTGPQLAAVLASLSTRPGAATTASPSADAGRPVQRRDDRGTADLARGVAGRAGRAAAAGPEPDIGFSEVAYGGRPAGRWPTCCRHRADRRDFVRWVRQVVDFAGQIADAAGPGELRMSPGGWCTACVAAW